VSTYGWDRVRGQMSAVVIFLSGGGTSCREVGGCKCLCNPEAGVHDGPTDERSAI